MSGSQGYPPPGSNPGAPPPGWSPPPQPQPTWAPPPVAPPPFPAPGMLGAAHKPGALPLRPLGLGDIYDAAFRVIRFNPKSTVGSAVLVAGVAMAAPVLVTAVLAAIFELSLDGGSGSTADDVATVAALGTLGIGSVLQYAGLVFVTGMIAHVVAAAAAGRRLSLGEAWAATRGRRWRLVGLTLLIGLSWGILLTAYVLASVVVVMVFDDWRPILAWFLVTLPAGAALSAWLWIRLTYFAVPALMLERIGVLAAIGRSHRLTSGQFWRTFGIALLTLVVTTIASQVLTVPFGIVAQVVAFGLSDSSVGLLVYVIANALGTVVATAFVAPFTSAVTSVQYLDQRMRKEAYDVELMAQAGITPS